jgi:hypothetical protein
MASTIVRDLLEKPRLRWRKEGKEVAQNCAEYTDMFIHKYADTQATYRSMSP